MEPANRKTGLYHLGSPLSTSQYWNSDLHLEAAKITKREAEESTEWRHQKLITVRRAAFLPWVNRSRGYTRDAETGSGVYICNAAGWNRDFLPFCISGYLIPKLRKSTREPNTVDWVVRIWNWHSEVSGWKLGRRSAVISWVIRNFIQFL
jgi:hypothetical protein